MLKEKTIKVPKETDELASAIEELIIELIRAKRDDGKIDGSEIVVIATSLIGKMGPAIDGVGEIKQELKEHPEGFLLSWVAAGANVYKELAKEEDAKKEE